MDGVEDMDEDMVRAIALSLRESAAPPRPPASTNEYINISDDEDDAPSTRSVHKSNVNRDQYDADLQLALELSKQDAARASEPAPSPSPSPAPTPAAATPAPFLSERAQMEQERLARQKRLRPDLDMPASEEEQGRSAKRQHISSLSSATVRRTNAAASSSALASVSPRPPVAGSSEEQLFWTGELRQTANMHVDPAKDKRPVFRLTDILAPRDEIAFAIISSYVINWPWIYSFFKDTTPVIVAAHDPQGQETIKAVLPHWIKVSPFLRNGMGCMHMKFMLLFYKSGRLRVVVSTANLIEHDWRDIENTAWVQDVPARSSPIAHDPKATDFAAAMVRVLRAVNVAPALISHLRNDHPDLPMKRLEELRTHWDFSKVKAHLVPSIAGKHEGWPNVILAGHTALMKAVRDIGAKAEKGQELVLECQGSSVGTYSTQWMNEFHCSARGESADSWLDTPKARRAKLPYPPVKILFPSARTVRESALGEQGGGTMFCRRNQWAAAKFPRELFHHSKSKRGPVLMHSKMIIALYRSARPGSETEDSDDDEPKAVPPAGWLYMGSHNFTPSAWGTLSGSAFNPTLNITNFELGIVLPLRTAADADKVACWERPPRKYDLGPGKDEPWIQSESLAFAEAG